MLISGESDIPHTSARTIPEKRTVHGGWERPGDARPGVRDEYEVGRDFVFGQRYAAYAVA